MKSQITSIEKYDVNNGFNDVTTCFYIIAEPIQEKKEEDDKDEDELLAYLQDGDISESFINTRNISPFRTVLFPNDTRIMTLFTTIVDAANACIKAGKKPKLPTINLNRFEVDAPEPYFRRLTKDNEITSEKAGQWVIATKDEETLPNDPMNRKLFRTIWVTSICRTDSEGKDIPTENIVRKALRAWVNGTEKAEAGSGFMLNPAGKQLAKEAKKAAAKKPVITDDDDDIDEAMLAKLVAKQKAKKAAKFDDEEED